MNEFQNAPTLPAELRGKANRILEKKGVVALASVNPEGYPRVCILSVLGEKEIGNIIVSTGTNGTKTAHFRENPKAGVCVSDERDSVTLLGDVEFVTDMKVRKDIFVDWMYDHFNGPDDPNYCVISFRPTIATVWIEGHFGTYRV